MIRHVAFLRAVNVAGHKSILMGELRGLLSELGFDGVRSLLQTGNLVFSSEAQTAADLERFLEEEAAQRLNLRTDFFVRTAKQLNAIVANNPFRKEAKHDPAHLVVMFLKRAPGAGEVKALQAAIAGQETVFVSGSQTYIVYPFGIGRSRLTGTFVEKHFGTRATARNWNTVLKLASLAGGDGVML